MTIQKKSQKNNDQTVIKETMRKWGDLINKISCS